MSELGLRKRRDDAGHHNGAIHSWSGVRVRRGAAYGQELLYVNEPRRPDGAVALLADGGVRPARGIPHLHVVSPSSTTPPGAVEDPGGDPRATCRGVRRGCHDVCSKRMDGSRGIRNSVAQEHILRADPISVELKVPRGGVARINLLKSHLKDTLRGV